MRTNQQERENFLLAMQHEGVPADVARKVLRHAATIQRLAVVACSDEAADRDRIACPEEGPPARRLGRTGPEINCLCRDYGSYDEARSLHGRVPRYMRREKQAADRINELLRPFGVVPLYGGDPRGACVKLKVPSGRTDDWGQTGLCVPTPNY